MRLQIKPSYILFLIVVLTLAFRLYVAFNSDSFSSGEAYFNLRYINHILQEKGIMYYDELSYGGRSLMQPPLFYFVMAVLSFGSVFMLKLIPEILFSLLAVVIYLMAKDISGNEYSALFSALLASFVPIFLRETLNVISIYSLALPILFFMLYSSLRLENKYYLWAFILCSFLLPLIHPIAIVFVITILFYFLLLSGGALNATKLKKEAFLFSFLAIVFLELLVYKKAFFSYGLGIITQGIPVSILADKFRVLSVGELVIGVGLLPLLLGSIGVYLGITQEKKKQIYLYSAFVLGILSLLALRLITISIGLMIIGLALCIFASLCITKFFDYFNKTRFAGLTYFFVVILLILFVISLVPAYATSKAIRGISEEKLNDMKWIRENTDRDAVVLGNLDEGHLITALANRKNVVDTNFLLAPNPIKRLRDVETVYTTFTEAKILEILKKYNIKVIYFSEDTKQYYFVRHLKYTKDSECFRGAGNFYVVEC